MKNDSISMLQVTLLTMTVIGLKNHVTIIPPLLLHAGRSGWVSTLLSSFILMFWVLLLVYIHNKTNKAEIKKWLQERIGKVWSKVFNFTIAIFLILLAAFTMKEVLQWINATFLIETPVYYLLLIYTILCMVLASSNINTIVITNFFVLIGVVVFGFFVAITNIQVKDYNLLRPFFEDGFQPVLKSIVFPASGMIELAMLLFLQHQIKDRIRFFHYVIIIVILTVLTLGPLIGAIAEFGPDEAIKLRYPAYEEWGLVSIGRFIEHLDFLSIYQWLTGAFIRVGFILYIAISLFHISGNKKTKLKKIWGFVTPLFLLMCVGLLMIEDQVFVKLKGDYFLPITLFVFLIISLLIVLFTFMPSKSSQKKKRTNNSEGHDGKSQSSRREN